MKSYLILPRNTCDCHAHVFEPAAYPYAAHRTYTPAAARADELQTVHHELGIERSVLIQPSVYGTDNRCLLDALQRLGPDRARGVAVVDLLNITSPELWSLHEAGVRGVRLNLKVEGGGVEAARLQLMNARRALELPGWSLHVHASLDLAVLLMEDFRRLESPVILDHYAGGPMPEANGHRLLERLLTELRQAPIYVKLSAPYRLSQGSSVGQLGRAFYDAAPDRVLWGTDWPHTGGHDRQRRSPESIEPFYEVDNLTVLQDLLACLPDESARRRLLVSNPAALYGFDD